MSGRQGLDDAQVRALGGPDRQWLLAEVDRLLDTAAGAALPQGGFGWLDAEGGVDASRGRQLWISDRMVHSLSLGHLLGRERDGDLVDAGVAALLGDFADVRNGGWWADPDRLSGAGDRVKGAYGHAFVVLAASSATVAGRRRAADLLEQALAVQNEHFWDDAAGAVVEQWDETFTGLDPYRGANANMHSVEAYLSAADATGDRIWRARALRICERIINDADSGARGYSWRVPEHFDASWNVVEDYNAAAPADPFRPYGITPGHGLEWSRLLLQLEAALTADGAPPPAWLREAAIGLFDRALSDGWDETNGGIVYTTDWNGTPVVEQHFHWVICEGIAAAATLHAVTGEPRYAQTYRSMWDYARRVYLDGRPGWQMEVEPDGAPSAVTWVGRPDVYHAVQAALVPLLPQAPGFAAALAR